MSSAMVLPASLEVSAEPRVASVTARRPDLIRLLLRGPRAMNEELQDPAVLPIRLVQLLTISAFTFALHGAVVGLMAMLLEHELLIVPLGAHLYLSLPIAFTVGLIGALGLCLPVFLFCAQMSGIEASPALVAVQALRAKSTSALALFGLLPIYIAVGLGTLWLHRGADIAVIFGLLLPVLAGIVGIVAIYQGFVDLAQRQQMPKERLGVVKTMVVCASAVYGVVAPVALVWMCALLWNRL